MLTVAYDTAGPTVTAIPNHAMDEHPPYGAKTRKGRMRDAGCMTNHRAAGDTPPAPLPPRRTANKPLSGWTVLSYIVVGLLLASGALWAQLAWLDSQPLPSDKRVDAVLRAAALSVSTLGAVGAVFVAYLAVRRQRTHEQELETRRAELDTRRAEVDVLHAELAQRDRAQEHTEQAAEGTRELAKQVAIDTAIEAAARREADQFTQAISHLGSDAAPVRLAGLLTLEQLAQESDSRREAVLDLVCGYLRMPFEPPDPTLLEAPPSREDQTSKTHTDYQINIREREVRLTAQKLLNTHLSPLRDKQGKPTNHKYWGGDTRVELDLTGATLMNFSLNGCEVGDLHFGGANFYGDTYFTLMVVQGVTNFDHACFHNKPHLALGKPTTEIEWWPPKNSNEANFMSTRFQESVTLRHVKFLCDARFHGSVKFAQDLWLTDAVFEGEVDFFGVTLNQVHHANTATFKRGFPQQFKQQNN
ncbi:hypothetical protein ACQPYE_17765 [Actinosynnema sp. CA-299493]